MSGSSRREWPPPKLPWVMRQTWRHLLFAHWPLDARWLEPCIPAGLELDRYEGQPWLSITPFELTDLRMRGLPAVPGVSSFPELNVRTYVRVEGKPGIFFFSLDAGSAIASAAARLTLRLPYRHASMHVRREGEVVHYDCRRNGEGGAAFRASYRPLGDPFEARAGSLEEWLTERYCLYTRIAGRLCRLEIDHRPWVLHASEASIEVNTMTAPLGFTLPPPVHLQYSARQDVVVWPPYAVAGKTPRSAFSARRA